MKLFITKRDISISTHYTIELLNRDKSMISCALEIDCRFVGCRFTHVVVQMNESCQVLFRQI